MSTSRLGEVFRYSGILVFALAVSAPVAELAFRMAGDVPSHDLSGLYEPFGGSSYKLRPSVDTDAYWATGRVAVHTDALGLRADLKRRFGARPGDAVDIILAGDSQGFGNGVNFENSLAGVIAERAAREGYRVVNAAVGGHSLTTQLALVRWLHEARGLRAAHLVVLLTPAMIRGCDSPNVAVVGADGRLYGDEVSVSARTRLWMKTHVVLYSRLRDAIRNLGIGTDPARHSSDVFQFYEPGEKEQELQNRLYSCMSQLSEFSRRQGLATHLIYVPLTIEADFEPIRRAAAHDGAHLDIEVPYRVSRLVAGHFGLPLSSLRPTLEAQHARGIMLNVKADFHYSAALSAACGASAWAALDLPPRPAWQHETRGETESGSH